MKIYEIQRIGPGSVFKFNFILGLVIGFLLSLILVFSGVTLNGIGNQLGTIQFNSAESFQLGAVILGVVIVSLAYALFLGVGGAIGAFIYNIFAKWVGGIVVRVTEKE